MLVQRQRKDLFTARFEPAGRHQIGDGGGLFVLGVDLEQRLGPVALLGVDGVHLLADIGGADLGEGGGELLVLADHAVAEGEDVHATRGAHAAAIQSLRLWRDSIEPTACVCQMRE